VPLPAARRQNGARIHDAEDWYEGCEIRPGHNVTSATLRGAAMAADPP